MLQVMFFDHPIWSACEDYRVPAWGGKMLNEHRVGDAPFAIGPVTGGNAERVVPMETVLAMHSVERVDLLPAEDVFFRLVCVDQPDASVGVF